MIKYHDEIEQGTDKWLEIRRGILTASEISKIITPTLKVADNEDTRSHTYEILAQRISGYVEPTYINDDMLRGHEEEILAREAYPQEVKTTGFITNDDMGFIIGYSPDGLVGDDGLIEIKSRRQKYQVETILSKGMPDNKKLNCMLQIQFGLLVSGRKWCDFISYHGGLPMMIKRIYPISEYQEALKAACIIFEERVQFLHNQYNEITASKEVKLIPTNRVIQEEITV